MRGATSVLDQAVFSGTNFLIQILLARWFSPEEYGAIAVSFVVILFLSGFHNAFVLEPMSVFGPASFGEDLRHYILAHARIHIALTSLIGGLLTLGALAARSMLRSTSPLVPAFAGAGLALPFILWIWFARRSAYVTQRPRLALLGSLAYCGLSIALFGATGLSGRLTISPLVPYVLFALASLLAGVLTFWLVLRADQGLAEGSPGDWRGILRHNWQYGRWVAASGVLSSTAGQLQTVALAFAGLAEAGALRAMQNFMLPMAQSITSIAQLGLPAIARDFGRGDLQQMKRKGWLVSISLGVLALAYEAILIIFHAPLERLAYGGKFADQSGLIPLLGLVPILSGIGTGFSLILRAVQWPQHALYATSVSGLVGLASAVLLTWGYGITGAAFSVVLTYATASAVTLALYRRRGELVNPGSITRGPGTA